MAVISSDKELNQRVERVCDLYNGFVKPVFVSDVSEALEFLKYELPEINVVNLSDSQIPVQEILSAIKADPWLHFGGIVGVYPSARRAEVLEMTKGMNVVGLLSRRDFVQGFYRILKILDQNRQIIFQRDLQNFLMKSLSSSLIMDNDPANVGIYANLVANYLYNANFISSDLKFHVHGALFELLMNAVEHGNCEITYEEKTAWLETHGDILELLRLKCQDAGIKQKKVYFSYRITEARSFFTVKDEGSGFDWKSHIEKPADSAGLGSHGRGIYMADSYVENLRYNNKGNEVSFEISHQKNATNVMPSIFLDQDEVLFEDGEVIFREDEESDYLYYIVAGSMEVFRKGELISYIGPDDLFLGEMSFLLSNVRSATVKAKGQCVLVPVSKHAFVNIIKQQPHYGIFLARLLAGRLERLNTYVAELQIGRKGIL